MILFSFQPVPREPINPPWSRETKDLVWNVLMPNKLPRWEAGTFCSVDAMTGFNSSMKSAKFCPVERWSLPRTVVLSPAATIALMCSTRLVAFSVTRVMSCAMDHPSGFVCPMDSGVGYNRGTKFSWVNFHFDNDLLGVSPKSVECWDHRETETWFASTISRNLCTASTLWARIANSRATSDTVWWVPLHDFVCLSHFGRDCKLIANVIDYRLFSMTAGGRFLLFFYFAAIKCGRLRKPSFGAIYPESCSQRKMPFGQRCAFACQPGFRLEGPTLRECILPGVWTGGTGSTRCVGNGS